MVSIDHMPLIAKLLCRVSSVYSLLWKDLLQTDQGNSGRVQQWPERRIEEIVDISVPTPLAYLIVILSWRMEHNLGATSKDSLGRSV